MENRRQVFALLLVSFLTLFGEMMFIRYISSSIYLLSYYKNAVLISIFFGLGIGFMTPGKKPLIGLLPVASLVLICVLIYFNDYLRIDLDYATMDESVWPEFWANSRARGVPVFAVLVFFYLALALYFIPLGRETVRLMEGLKPIFAYSVNIIGALAGIIVFSVLGWLWTTPLVWFAVFLIPLLWLSRRHSTRTSFWLGALSVLVSLFLVFTSVYGPEVWSPYSKIRVYPFKDANSGFISTTNGNPQVGSMNFDIEYKGPEAALNLESKRIYEIPYNSSSSRPSRVMVVGAGAGNETAMALRHGAASVDAVEIDPVFVTIGGALNPHRPYSDKRVNIHIDDARAFFQNTPSRYDLIVIGFLDSQYHLTQMSNIRTENFVYTYESLKKTKELLTPFGMLQLNYNAPRVDMRLKLYGMLKEVYGEDLVVYAPAKPVSGNISYLAGPGVRGLKKDQPGLTSGVFTQRISKEDYPTDDWPFLYLQSKKIPSEYWPMLVFIPILSLVMIKAIGKDVEGLSLRFFMLGAGFMLLETKSVTSFALLFGSTVTVVSIVIASILASALFANLAVYALGLRSVRMPYILLFITLIALYFLPLELFAGLSWWARFAVSAALVSAPLFFAAIVFAVSFSGSQNMGRDLGSNVFGAVVGGMSEYLSMAFGFKTLYLLSLAAYIIAFLAGSKGGEGDV